MSTTTSEPSNFRFLSVCPHDGEPLISDFSVRKKEWRCMVCGRFFEFLGVSTKKGTPELNARYDALCATDEQGAQE